ncbi:MAG: GntR family transcriptional regulator [Spirochaetales bacterium]|nr:GntR family transcriptional regulator [Spirochaetales bacterium]
MKPKSSPTYLQIEEQMITYFRRNNFSYGDKLPTEHQLMEVYDVSRTTIRKTLEVLKNKGLIDKSQGSGTFYTGRPNSVAGGKKGKTLGLVNYFFMDYIYTEILRGIEEEASLAGYSVMIANSYRSDEKQCENIENLLKQNVDGLILEPTHSLQINSNHPIHQILEKSGVPVVTTHWGISSKSLSTVTLDDVYAGKLAARYLLDKGHRKIAYIYKEDIQAGDDRHKGLTSELNKSGVPLQEKYRYPYNDFDEEQNGLQGYLLTRKLIEENTDDPPTAIFYFNDNLAIQGYKALAELGINVPEDISILGFDDHSNAAIVSPPLTTFAHPKYDLGRWVAKILIDEIENESKALPMKLIFEPKLVERGSVSSLI